MRRLSSRFSRSIGLFDQIFDQCAVGKRGVGEHVVLHCLEPLGDRRGVGRELIDDGAQLEAGGVGVGLSEHGADQRSDHRPLPVMGRGEQVAHRMDPTPLPGGALEAAGDRFDQPGMGVGDHEPHAGQAAIGEAGEELTPERLVLRVADIDTEHLTMPIGTQPGGDHDRLRGDVTVLADMHVGGIQPDVDERLMIEPAGAQHGDVGVDPGTDPRHRRLRHP